MSHARIEEVEDSDLDASDPSEGDISDVNSDFDERDILKARAAPSRTTNDAHAAKSALISPENIPSAQRPGQPNINNIAAGTPFQATEDESKYKDFQCLYPVYFDKNRTRAEGRRVGKELAVENPVAREIANACARLGLESCFEMMKTHPKDWGNPGRVKVKLKGGRNSMVKNKHHLYILVAQHLQANPTTIGHSTQIRMPGLPVPDPKKPFPHPAVPKGWKLNSIVPYYSAAMSGGGVSDNMFRDMMQEMQGAGMGGLPGMGGMPGMMEGAAGASGQVEKKEKKDKKKKGK
ncbi:signal recognition particle protein Sec65 [Coleophoma crateriformis]|uniref:Signal recognition particle protein Sec65 n=1 Tax=Coleophoma crateriformis TaxID=565419 RepID=A0A3D8T7A1_9HELO|nr:signal recognition particle protein Sec65 [Coleophoma crateriformis]